MKHLLVIMACIVASESCTCAPFSSLKEEFCSSDFVSHVNVTGRIRTNSTGFQFYYVYGIRHIRMYRKPSNTTTLPNRVSTASQSAACGITLTRGTEYLLGGSVDEKGELQINLCGLHRPWSSVSSADRAALNTTKC